MKKLLAVSWLCGRRVLTYAVLLLVSGRTVTYGQSAAGASPDRPTSEPVIEEVGDGKAYTLHVTTREVVVEVVARDRNNHPVNDLSESDFEVFESGHKSKDERRDISAFRTIDPATGPADYDELSRSVVLPLGGRCEIRSTVHYEIAFHPTKWVSGYHSIRVTTTRRHITLSYRTQYYVGISDVDAHPARVDASRLDSDLVNAACYHSAVPSSLSLSARKLVANDPSELYYSVDVLPSSLQAAGVEEGSHHIQLQYGVCTFDRTGDVVGYWHFSEDRSLNALETETVLSDGWTESVVVPHKGTPALARFVVLEPKSGNIGSIELATNVRTPPDDPGESEANDPKHVLIPSDESYVRGRTAQSLGSPVPRRGALCGDVYELPTTTTFLPSDFKVLNSVGAVYTNSLNVGEQILHQGIPGSTSQHEWFGIDYYGEFWVSKPGKYLFVLNADDGADLYVDDQKLISDDGIHPPQTVSKSIALKTGRHTIHLPYFQGPTYVNLILQVNPPDEVVKVFDVRGFANPSLHPKSAP
jgi:hypothetical protein